jgi:hypothetical protein
MSKRLIRKGLDTVTKQRAWGRAAPMVAPVLRSVQDMDQWILETLRHLAMDYLIPVTEVMMSMTGDSDHIGFDVEDDSIVPCIPIPWDKRIIKQSISLIKYDHVTRMIFASGGKVKGFIFVDDAGTVRWLATDDNYLE